ncbi:hypothetical protein [Pseudonocardia sp. GCM10023141]|uniref:hypothetical protein n=1 Tax=Pseudonocardia sp. GCM10023141 TaxID=3252653 RepID=UPI00360EC90E
MIERQVVELRVHGVSGTPAGELLDRALVRQVAGDTTAGFYRPQLAAETLDEPIPPAAVPTTAAHLEGYAWGGLTSGAPSRALWLLLLPFAVINVASRLRRTNRRLLLQLALHRLAALAATVALLVAMTGIGADLVGWQCGGGTQGGSAADIDVRCGGLPDWFARWLTGLPPGSRLLVGAALPVAVLIILWLLSRRSAQRYEHVPDGKPLGAPSTSGDPDEPDPAMASEWMWRGAYMVDRLRRLHLAGGAAGMLTVLSTTLGAVWFWAVAATAAAGLVTVAVALCTPSVVGRSARATPEANGTQRAAFTAVTVSAALAAVALATGQVTTTTAPGLPGYDLLISIGFAVQLLLVLAIVVVSGRPGAGLANWRAPMFVALGTLLGAVFSAGAYIYVATWLATGDVAPGIGKMESSRRDLVVPPALQAAAEALTWTLAGLLVALAVGVVAAVRSRRRALAGPLGAGYPAVTDPRADRPRQILSIFWQARLVDSVGTPVVALLATVTATAAVVTAVTLAFAVAAPADTPWLSAWEWTYQLGAYAAAGGLVLLVGLGAAVFRVGRTRRSVGILWDLASFWPRSVHPLAPPCYAERTVPDLKERIRWHVNGLSGEASDLPRGALVLAAHSQGTVITAAALLQLQAHPDKERVDLAHVAFLSYGCVLQRLYADYFPLYLGEAQLKDLDRAVGDDRRWLNLWRRSDHLGGPVSRNPVDRQLVDPRYSPVPGDLSYPAPGRHSMYPRDPAFQQAVADLAERLPPAAPGTPEAAPRTLP